MSESQKYTSKAIEVSAVMLGQYGDFVRSTKWINENGGRAYFSPDTKEQPEEDSIAVVVGHDLMYGYRGDYVVLGVTGEFSIVERAIFEASFDKVPENHVTEWDATPGVYQPKGQPGHSLLGAAAVAP